LHPVLRELVSRVDREWQRANFSAADFPKIAADILDSGRVYRRLDPVDVLRDIGRGSRADGAFLGRHTAQGVLPLFRGARFAVHLHAWQNNVGDPHSHAWSGAYQLLQGTCVTGSFSFAEKSSLEPKLKIGQLRLNGLELQKPGMTIRVPAGAAYIHGQSYADKVGLSLSIRSEEKGNHLTFTYWRPGVALETNLVDDVADRQIKALDALHSMRSVECRRTLRSALRRADLRTAFLLLAHIRSRYAQDIDTEALSREASARFGTYASIVLGGLAAIDRKAFFERRREDLGKWDHRFICSILFLAENRAQVLRLIREQYPKRSPELFLSRTIVEMASAPSGARTLLGTPVDPDLPVILALMLKDEQPESVLRRMAKDYRAEDLRVRAPLLRSTMRALRSLPVLRPLFS
jgi:hypothetical protein